MEAIFVAGNISDVEDPIFDGPMFTEVGLNSIWRKLRKMTTGNPRGGFNRCPISLVPGSTIAADQSTESDAWPIEVLFQIVSQLLR